MRLFISVAAYCDPVLPFTLRRAYTQARWPERLRFGVIDQSPASMQFRGDNDVPPMQVDCIHIDPREARGVCWARALAMTLYDEEDWFLQIDSHMDFVPGWDALFIEQAERIARRQPQFVISSYPNGFVFDNGRPVPRVATTRVLAHVLREDAQFMSQHPVLSFMAQPVDLPGVDLVRGFHLGAGCLFAPGTYARRFPYDPYLYFAGEEQALAARLFTHGWDIFHMSGLPVYHLYNDGTGTRRLHWDAEEDRGRRLKWSELQQRSMTRLSGLLSRQGSSLDFGPYALGRARSLEDYAQFSGIDYLGRRIEPKAWRGPWNPAPLQPPAA